MKEIMKTNLYFAEFRMTQLIRSKPIRWYQMSTFRLILSDLEPKILLDIGSELRTTN